MADVELLIGDKLYSGWEEMTVTRSLEAVAGSFSMKAINKAGLDVLPGDKCKILLDGNIVIDGYIDSVNYSISSSDQSIEINGRDRTGDLVDCSALNKTGEFLSITLKDLITKIVEPFGIKVVFNATPSTTKTKVSLQQDTAFEVIERETRKAGLFAFSDGQGNLVIDNIGSKTANTALVVGDNVKKLTSSIDYSQRFSKYVVKGQQSGNDDTEVRQTAQVTATATDANVTRYRPTIIFAESSINAKQAKDRVEWEASVRAARAEEVNVTVPAWIQENGNLWDINTLVTLKIPNLKYLDTKLIKQVTYSLDISGGSVCEMILVDEGSYAPKPDVPKKSKAKTISPAAIDPDIDEFEYEL